MKNKDTILFKLLKGANLTNILKPEQIIKNFHPDEIHALVWDNEQIVTACADMNIRMIDVKNSKVLKTIAFETKPISMAINQQSRMLFIGGENGRIYKLDLKTGTSTVFKESLKGRVSCLSLNKNQEMLAFGTSDGVCGIFTLKNPNAEPVNLHGHKAAITDIKFSPTSNQIATCSLDGSVRLWNADKADDPAIVFKEHDGWVLELAFNSTGKFLVSSGNDKTIRLYPISPTEMASELRKYVKRNLSKVEWLEFIGMDIPYQKTVSL